MYGLKQGATLREIIVKQDENTAIKYILAERKIDLDQLRREKASLERQLADKPTPEQLLQMAREQHPYYSGREDKEERIAVINAILK